MRRQGNNIQVFQNKTPNFGDASIGFVQRKVAYLLLCNEKWHSVAECKAIDTCTIVVLTVVTNCIGIPPVQFLCEL